MNDADLKELIEKTAAETSRHFDVVAERTERKIAVVAEGVASLGEALRGEIEGLKDETRRGFTETQAMIKFSHAELDRRVRVLEEVVLTLQTRIERLESSSQ